MPTVAELSVEVDVNDNATSPLERIDALLKRLETGQTKVEVDAETTTAEADLKYLQDTLFEMEHNNVNVAVDADTGAAQADLEVLRAAEDSIDNKVKIQADADVAGAVTELAVLDEAEKKVDRDGRNMGGSKPFNGIIGDARIASNQVSALAMAIVGLGTALVPIGAVALAGIGALAASLAAAGAGAILFAGVAYTAFAPIKDIITKMTAAQQAYNVAVTNKQRQDALAKEKALFDSLSPSEQAVALGWQKMSDAWSAFTAKFQPELFSIAGNAMRGIGQVIPNLTTLMSAMVQSVNDLGQSIETNLGGPTWRGFLDTANQIAGPTFTALLRGIGELITGILSLAQAFAPWAIGFSLGFQNMASSFADWAAKVGQTQGFKDFMGYVTANMPGVFGALGSLSNAILAILEAAAPIGPVVLDVIKRLADAIVFLNSTNPNLLTLILTIAGLSVILLNLLGPTLSFIRVFGDLAKAISGVGDVLAFLATPAGIVLLIIAALVAAAVYAYFHFDNFRQIVDTVAQKLLEFAQAAGPAIVGAFDAIVGAAQTAWAWITGTMVPAIEGAFNAVVSAIQTFIGWMQATFGPAVTAVVDFVTQEWQKWVDWWNQTLPSLEAVWTSMSNFVITVFGPMVSFIETGLQALQGIWNAVWPAIEGVLSAAWESMKSIVSIAVTLIVSIITVAWDLIKSVISGAMDIIRGIISVVLGIITGNWTQVWDGIVSILRGVWSIISGVISAALGTAQALMSAGMAAVQAVWTGIWNSIVSVLRGIWNTIVSTINGFQSTVSAAVRAVVNAGLQAINSIAGNFFSAGANLIRNMASGIASSIGAVISAVQGIIAGAVSHLPGSPAKVGPLSGQGWSYIRGQHLVNDLAEGMDANAWRLNASAQDLADLMTLTFAPEASYNAITQPTSTNVTVAPGAVAIQMAPGTTAADAQATLGSAGDELARQILTSIRRR